MDQDEEGLAVPQVLEGSVLVWAELVPVPEGSAPLPAELVPVPEGLVLLPAVSVLWLAEQVSQLEGPVPLLVESVTVLSELDSLPAGYVTLLVGSNPAEETSTEGPVYLTLPPSQMTPNDQVGDVVETVLEWRKKYLWVNYPLWMSLLFPGTLDQRV